jgi:hypothetical protein
MQGMMTGNFNNMGKPMPTQQPANARQQASKPTDAYGNLPPATNGRPITSTPNQGTRDNFGDLLNNAQRQQNTANGMYDSLLSGMNSINQNQLAALNNSKTAGNSSYANADQAYSQAMTARDPYDQRALAQYDRAGNRIQQSEFNANAASETNKWYDQYAQGNLQNANELLATGNIPAALEARFMDTINRGTKSGMGNLLNDMAKRGVVNSSITGQGIDQLSKNAAQAYNDNYLETFNSVLGGYQGNAQTAGQTGKNLADTYLNINNNLNSGAQTAMGLADSLSGAGSQKMNDFTNLGNAYQGAGSQRIADQLGIAQGYGDAAAGQRAQMDGLMNDIPKYWTNALAGLGLPLSFLEQMQKARATDTKTTVVEQGGKK